MIPILLLNSNYEIEAFILLAFNIKNIIVKYISNKQINSKQSNNI